MMVDKTPFQSFLPFNYLDDSSFNLAIYEFSYGPLSYFADRLETLLFNTVERPELFNPLSSHLNPDSKFITRLPNSGYMVEEDLNNRVTSFGDKTNFSIIHFNTRSLMRNFDQLNLLLRNLNMPFSVIGVSETWLTDCTAELVNITGYNFVSNHCKSKTGGGVGTFFLKNGVEYKLLEESKFSDPDVIESLFLEIMVSHGKNIVGCVYRPPNQNTAMFIDKFKNILSLFARDNRHCYVIGDLNLDLL